MEGSYTTMYISINIYTYIYSDLKKRIHLLHQADHIYIPWDKLSCSKNCLLMGLAATHRTRQITECRN